MSPQSRSGGGGPFYVISYGYGAATYATLAVFANSLIAANSDVE